MIREKVDLTTKEIVQHMAFEDSRTPHDMIMEIRFLTDELSKVIVDMSEDVKRLNRLRNAGVDNWEGYDFAMRDDNDEDNNE